MKRLSRRVGIAGAAATGMVAAIVMMAASALGASVIGGQETSGSYTAGCTFSSPGSGTYTPTSSGNAGASFTTVNISAGTGGIDSHASGATVAGHELAGQWLAFYCNQPYYLAGGSSHSQVSVTFNYSYSATVKLVASCQGGTAVASGNSSVEGYEYGLTPSGRHGTIQASLYSYTQTCTSHTYTPSSTGSITTGWASYTSADWVDFHFIVWAGANAFGFPNGNGGNADNSITFTVTQITVYLQ